MSFTLIHELVMYLMGGAMLLATYVIVERILFFMATLKEGKEVSAFVSSHLHDKKLHGEVIDTFANRRSPQAQALCEVAKASQARPTFPRRPGTAPGPCRLLGARAA